MKKNKSLSYIISFFAVTLLLLTTLFLPLKATFTSSVKAEQVGGDLYAFVSKQTTKTQGEKIYLDFGLSLDYTLEDEDFDIARWNEEELAILDNGGIYYEDLEEDDYE